MNAAKRYCVLKSHDKPCFLRPITTGACRALQRLYLGSASVRDAGVHELVAALQQSSSVKEKLQVGGFVG